MQDHRFGHKRLGPHKCEICEKVNKQRMEENFAHQMQQMMEHVCEDCGEKGTVHKKNCKKMRYIFGDWDPNRDA